MQGCWVAVLILFTTSRVVLCLDDPAEGSYNDDVPNSTTLAPLPNGKDLNEILDDIELYMLPVLYEVMEQVRLMGSFICAVSPFGCGGNAMVDSEEFQKVYDTFYVLWKPDLLDGLRCIQTAEDDRFFCIVEAIAKYFSMAQQAARVFHWSLIPWGELPRTTTKKPGATTKKAKLGGGGTDIMDVITGLVGNLFAEHDEQRGRRRRKKRAVTWPPHGLRKRVKRSGMEYYILDAEWKRFCKPRKYCDNRVLKAIFISAILKRNRGEDLTIKKRVHASATTTHSEEMRLVSRMLALIDSLRRHRIRNHGPRSKRWRFHVKSGTGE